MRNSNFIPASLELTKKASEKMVRVLALDGDSSTVMEGLEEGSFDLSCNGEDWDGGSYIVDESGNIRLCSVTPQREIGNVDMSELEIRHRMYNA